MTSDACASLGSLNQVGRTVLAGLHHPHGACRDVFNGTEMFYNPSGVAALQATLRRSSSNNALSEGSQRLANPGQFTQLSGGEQQMLAIGRALLRNPRLLLLDEPSEGLSPLVVDQLAQLMLQLHRQEGMALLLIEQNLRLALRVGDRVAVMVAGQIVHEASVQQFSVDTEAQARHLGLGTARCSSSPA